LLGSGIFDANRRASDEKMAADKKDEDRAAAPEYGWNEKAKKQTSSSQECHVAKFKRCNYK
jgi:hypothetical protein